MADVLIVLALDARAGRVTAALFIVRTGRMLLMALFRRKSEDIPRLLGLLEYTPTIEAHARFHRESPRNAVDDPRTIQPGKAPH